MWPFKKKKRYKRLALKFTDYGTADKLMKENDGKPESEQWVLALPEEDNNHVYGMVYIERKELIKPSTGITNKH